MATKNNNKSKNSVTKKLDKLADVNMDIGTPSFNLQEYIRVLKLARKPTREEFTMISKISVAGIVIIGMLGFVVYVLLTELPRSL